MHGLTHELTHPFAHPYVFIHVIAHQWGCRLPFLLLASLTDSFHSLSGPLRHTQMMCIWGGGGGGIKTKRGTFGAILLTPTKDWMLVWWTQGFMGYLPRLYKRTLPFVTILYLAVKVTYHNVTHVLLPLRNSVCSHVRSTARACMHACIYLCIYDVCCNHVAIITFYLFVCAYGVSPMLWDVYIAIYILRRTLCAQCGSPCPCASLSSSSSSSSSASSF